MSAGAPARARIRPPRRIRAGVRRARVPGAALTCLVLAGLAEEWVGVDLATGAFVRVRNAGPTAADPASDGAKTNGGPAGEAGAGEAGGAAATDAATPGTPGRFAVVSFVIADTDEPADPARPEAVSAGPLTRVGQARPRAARRLLKRLAAPADRRTPLLSGHGPSVAYVDLDGRSPSVVLVPVGARALEVMTREDGEVACALPFGLATQVFPVLDDTARHVALAARPRSLRGAALGDALGFRPGYVLAGLGAVHAGHARKAVFAILPR